MPLFRRHASRFLARQDRSTDSLLVDTGPLLNFICFVTAIKQGHSPTFHPFPPLYWLLLLGQKELASFSNREPLTLVFCSGLRLDRVVCTPKLRVLYSLCQPEFG